MTIIDISKQPSWADMLANLEVGQELNAPFEKSNTIRPIISRERRLIGRYFTTEKQVQKIKGKEVEVLNIKRVY